MQEEGPMPAWEESNGLGKNTMHPTPYILTSQHHFPPSYDHLKDEFHNVFGMTDADVRCIVRKVESTSFQNAVRHFFGAIEEAYSG